jgi:hypothetical protein
MTALKKPKATKCSDHCTQAKLLTRILRRRIERNIEDIFGDQFGFRRGKGTRDSTGVLLLMMMIKF